jgi:hypothetical protein
MQRNADVRTGMWGKNDDEKGEVCIFDLGLTVSL